MPDWELLLQIKNDLKWETDTQIKENKQSVFKYLLSEYLTAA